jgi:hypothetical protein
MSRADDEQAAHGWVQRRISQAEEAGEAAEAARQRREELEGKR